MRVSLECNSACVKRVAKKKKKRTNGRRRIKRKKVKSAIETYLARDRGEPAHERVPVRVRRAAVIDVLDDDRLLARVAALKHDDNLTGL